MFFTYILFSPSSGRFYTGQSMDIVHRLEEHNRGKTPSTVYGIPWKIVFCKEFLSRSEAVGLEKLIKKRGAARFLSDNNIAVG